MTLTDVSKREFGEGSFDKGIFFNIPIYGDFISYTWRPLTKDPGAKLIRSNTLYDLLVKFRDINWFNKTFLSRISIENVSKINVNCIAYKKKVLYNLPNMVIIT